MRKVWIALVLFLMSTLLFTAVAQAADVTVTLSYPLGGTDVTYFDVYVYIEAGDNVTMHFICSTQSATDTPGSIDPLFYVYGPDGGYVTYDDDSGTLNCAEYEDAIAAFTAPSSGVYRVSAYDISACCGSVETANGGSGVLTISGATVRGVDATNPLAADGRLNTQPWATAFVYCVAGYIDVYQLVGGQGERIIHELWSDVDALGDVEENTLIASSPDGTIRLYKLTSGELQVNAPMGGLFDGYVFRFINCTQMGAGLRVEGPYTGIPFG